MRIWRLTVGVLVGLWLFGGLWPAARLALAQGDLFTVHDISVDATAEDAASARVAALEDGHRQAMEMLLARIVPQDELLALPEILPNEIAQLVGDFTVDEERTSDVRYLATLTFRFNAESVRQFLGQRDVPFAQARGAPILVLPVMGTGGGAELWRDPNPWRDTWNARRLDGELIPIVLPLGDLDDLGAIDARRAVNGDRDGLETMMQRYGVEQVLVAQLRLIGDPAAGWATAEVVARLFGGPAENRPLVLSFNQEPEEEQGGLFRRAADGVVSEIQETWKVDNLLRFGEQNRLMVTIPVASLAEWLEVKRRLEDIASVVGSELAYMTRASVELMITYVGSEEQLTRALARKDLVLTRDRTQGWRHLMLDAPLPQSDSEPGVE
jgi:hypothetical protein